jgi:hypothetical protein
MQKCHIFATFRTLYENSTLCKYYITYYYYGFTALCWTLTAFSVSWSYTQSVGLVGRGISMSQGRYLHTEQHKHRIKAYSTDSHVLSGIRSHDPSVRAGEDGSCLRPRGHCDRQITYYTTKGPAVTWKYMYTDGDYTFRLLTYICLAKASILYSDFYKNKIY